MRPRPVSCEASRPLPGGCHLLCKVSRSVRPCLPFPDLAAMLSLPSTWMRHRTSEGWGAVAAAGCPVKHGGASGSAKSAGLHSALVAPGLVGRRRAGKERRVHKGHVREKAPLRALKKSRGGRCKTSKFGQDGEDGGPRVGCGSESLSWVGR